MLFQKKKKERKRDQQLNLDRRCSEIVNQLRHAIELTGSKNFVMQR